MDLEAVDRIIDEYEGDKASLVMILQDIQDAYNYLPQPALLHRHGPKEGRPVFTGDAGIRQGCAQKHSV